MKGLALGAAAEGRNGDFSTTCAVCEVDLTNEFLAGVLTTAGFQRLCQTSPGWAAKDCFTQVLDVADLDKPAKGTDESFEEFSARILKTIGEMSAVNTQRRLEIEQRNAEWEAHQHRQRERKNAQTVTVTLGLADFEELLDELADIPPGEMAGLDVLRTVDYLTEQGTR